MKSNFVVSNKSFTSIKEAEERINGQFNAGVVLQNTKLYKVVKVYKPVIKFELTK